MAAKKKVVKKTDAQTKELSLKSTAFLKVIKKLQKANKVVNDLKEEKTALEKELVALFESSKQLGTKVTMGSVNIKEEDYFSAKDWNKVNQHIEETGDFSLYQRRLNQTLLKDYWKDGERIPGVQHGIKKKITYGFKKS